MTKSHDCENLSTFRRCTEEIRLQGLPIQQYMKFIYVEFSFDVCIDRKTAAASFVQSQYTLMLRTINYKHTFLFQQNTNVQRTIKDKAFSLKNCS